MKRCHECMSAISTNHEVYVKGCVYHVNCAPEHTAEIHAKNVKRQLQLDDDWHRLIFERAQLKARIKKLETENAQLRQEKEGRASKK